jgi:hypothetical protein
MPKYLFVYRASNDYVPGGQEAMAAWTAFHEHLGDQVVDFGNPVFESSSLGNCGDSSTRLGGYSFVTADDLESAVALAKASPTLSTGGGVVVGEVSELM